MSRQHTASAAPFMDENGVMRRPFRARGSFTVRCPTCRLPELNCLCPYRVESDSAAVFWLITHAKESNKPTNTGRLIRDCFPSTELFEWSRTKPDSRLLALLNDPRYAPFLIFPDDQADYADRVVSYRAPAEGKIPTFIILDGTWRQARRMFRQSAYLSELPILPLHTERLTRYKLRTPASSSHLCTAEVAAELLYIVGDEAAGALLDDYFDAFNDSYAASRVHRKLSAPTDAMQRLSNRRLQRGNVEVSPGERTR